MKLTPYNLVCIATVFNSATIFMIVAFALCKGVHIDKYIKTNVEIKNE